MARKWLVNDSLMARSRLDNGRKIPVVRVGATDILFAVAGIKDAVA